MRPAIFGFAILVLGFGAFRFAMPGLIENAIGGGGDDCDSSHLTSKDLERFIPEDAPRFEQVYRSVQRCKSSGFPSEAELNLAYAATDSVESTARTMLANAERTGWTRIAPPAGKSVSVVNGSVTVSLKRTQGGQTVHFDASNFPSSAKPSPNPNANIAKIQATGAPTGVLLRIWVEGASAIPTIDAGFGVFPTPNVGIGR